MQTIGIKDLQINPAILTKSLEAKQYTMITKRSTPIGIAVSLDDEIISNGLKNFQMGIDIIDYDFKDELDGLESFL